MQIAFLSQKQNPDGGWPYVRGASWTEPTVYTVLALLAAGETEAAGRGVRWLRATQRPDGGWAPLPSVDESEWVTALVALVPPAQLGAQAHRRAIQWLLRTGGEESAFSYRLREWLLGNSPGPGSGVCGWPWMPGAAAWVGPTSLAILALEQEVSRRPSAVIRERIDSGRRFLLAHACEGGGWNHGSARAMGQDLRPYPETTGMALAAMRGVRSAKIGQAIGVATNFLAECRSADALNWLRLGLIAHGGLPEGYCPPARVERRTLPEASLDCLAAQAENGGGLFFS